MVQRKKRADDLSDFLSSIPRIALPPEEPPTAEELERRARAVAGIDALRKEITALNVSLADLVRRDRDSH